MVRVVLDRLASHFRDVLRLALVLGDGRFVRLPVFAPPVPQRMPVGVAELRYRVSVAMVESDECLYRDSSLLLVACVASFPFRFGPGFPSQSQMGKSRLRQTM